MIRARPSAEILTLAHELSAIAGLPGPSARPKRCNWNAWLELAEENQLSPLLGSRMISAGDRGGGVPERPLEIQSSLRGAHIQEARDSAFVHSELQQILAILRDVADPIALKGCALAYELYDHPSERPHDIGLLGNA